MSHIIMSIKKLIVFRCKSLNLLGVGELTPLPTSSLTPVSSNVIQIPLESKCKNPSNLIEQIGS